MAIQKRPKNEITKPNKSLGQLLKTENKRELIKYVSGLNVRKIYTDRTRVAEIETVLEHWRAKYKILAAQKKDPAVKNSPELNKELTYIETQAKALKEELSQYETVSTIGQLCQADEDELIGNLTLVILDMDEDFNVGKGLSVSQVETLAITISTTYKSLTLEDVALCFHRAKLGEYGVSYDRLDSNVINTWLKQYLTEVKQVHKSQVESDHSRSKSGMTYVPGDVTSMVRVAKERGIDMDKESRYDAFKTNLMADRKQSKSK